MHAYNSIVISPSKLPRATGAMWTRGAEGAGQALGSKYGLRLDGAAAGDGGLHGVGSHTGLGRPGGSQTLGLLPAEDIYWMLRLCWAGREKAKLIVSESHHGTFCSLSVWRQGLELKDWEAHQVLMKPLDSHTCHLHGLGKPRWTSIPPNLHISILFRISSSAIPSILATLPPLCVSSTHLFPRSHFI